MASNIRDGGMIQEEDDAKTLGLARDQLPDLVDRSDRIYLPPWYLDEDLNYDPIHRS